MQNKENENLSRYNVRNIEPGNYKYKLEKRDAKEERSAKLQAETIKKTRRV